MGQLKKDDPAVVAKQGFEAMLKGKDAAVAGALKTKVMAQANKVTPEATKAKMMGKLTEPGSA